MGILRDLGEYERTLSPREQKVFKVAYQKARESQGVELALAAGKAAVEEMKVKTRGYVCMAECDGMFEYEGTREKCEEAAKAAGWLVGADVAARCPRHYSGDEIEIVRDGIEVWLKHGVPRAVFAVWPKGRGNFTPVEEDVEEHYGRPLSWGLWAELTPEDRAELPVDMVSLDAATLYVARVDGWGPEVEE